MVRDGSSRSPEDTITTAWFLLKHLNARRLCLGAIQSLGVSYPLSCESGIGGGMGNGPGMGMGPGMGNDFGGNDVVQGRVVDGA